MTKDEQIGMKALLTMLLVKYGERGFESFHTGYMADQLRQAGYDIPDSPCRVLFDLHMIRFVSLESWLYVLTKRGKEFLNE